MSSLNMIMDHFTFALLTIPNMKFWDFLQILSCNYKHFIYIYKKLIPKSGALTGAPVGAFRSMYVLTVLKKNYGFSTAGYRIEIVNK